MKTFLALISVVSLSVFQLSCSTTKDANGGTTTTLTQSGDAAVAAAVQIATVAANAAIQTYLTSAPATPHARITTANPALAAAKRSTETEIRNALPNLPASKIHGIVSTTYARCLAKNLADANSP